MAGVYCGAQEGSGGAWETKWAWQKTCRGYYFAQHFVIQRGRRTECRDRAHTADTVLLLGVCVMASAGVTVGLAAVAVPISSKTSGSD
jgi:hypothetical protein